MRIDQKAALQARVVDGSCHLRVTRSLAWDRCWHRCCIKCRPGDALTTPLGRLCLAATTVGAAFTMCAAAFLHSFVVQTGVTRPAVLDAARFDSSVDLAAMARLTGASGSRDRGASCEFTVRAALLHILDGALCRGEVNWLIAVRPPLQGMLSTHCGPYKHRSAHTTLSG